MKHPTYDYDMMLPDEILKQTLATIEKIYPAQRSWLTQVHRGLPNHSLEVQDDYREAREHLFRIGYRPASEDVPPPVKRVRRGKGSY